MSSTYFYGLIDEEVYYNRDLYSAVEEELGSHIEPFVIIEMKVSRKHGERWCMVDLEFAEDCGKLWCDRYSPRNGKNGICEHQSWGLVATGREWLVDPITEEVKKISCRRKKKHGN